MGNEFMLTSLGRKGRKGMARQKKKQVGIVEGVAKCTKCSTALGPGGVCAHCLLMAQFGKRKLMKSDQPCPKCGDPEPSLSAEYGCVQCLSNHNHIATINPEGEVILGEPPQLQDQNTRASSIIYRVLLHGFFVYSVYTAFVWLKTHGWWFWK